jgi:serine/threonine protein kinase
MHLSGFVFKVLVPGGQTLIKKEIPGPDNVDEFLYEINALHSLRESNAKSVIRFEGLILDNERNLVKGLLISYAERGALVDMIYDERGNLPWSLRERWAQQIVEGLSEIHEAGFVQGDFTLSNIVIDENDSAKIIDINRRGCPVGWEPPELSKLIESSQRISMYIGVKSDLFQLGMVLWAIAEEQDEPETKERPLTLESAADDVPLYYREIVSLCLHENPQNRLSARELLSKFPKCNDADATPPRNDVADVPPGLSDVQFPNPSAKSDQIGIENPAGLEAELSNGRAVIPPSNSTNMNATTPITPSATDFTRLESISLPGQDDVIPHTLYASHSTIEPPAFNDHILDDAQIITVSPTEHGQWKEIHVDGNPYLINRRSIELDDSAKRITSITSDAVGREGLQQPPLETDVIFPPLMGELAGIGEHSTLQDCKSPEGPLETDP